MSPFLSYSQYQFGMDKTTGKYDFTKDFNGPLAFLPINCQDADQKKATAKTNEAAADQDKEDERSSYASPIIAVVGQTNTIQSAMQD
jgi:hypothetical protein